MLSKTPKRAPTRADKKAAPEKIAPPTAPAPQQFSRLLESLSSVERKRYPMTTGLTDYFPDALAATANVSWVGNEKHNPGESLHHARGKSNDHADCCARHLAQRGTSEVVTLSSGEPVVVRHSAQLAWRALALLQEELEADEALTLPRGATAA